LGLQLPANYVYFGLERGKSLNAASHGAGLLQQRRSPPHVRAAAAHAELRQKHAAAYLIARKF
jgi:hypothetical protein